MPSDPPAHRLLAVARRNADPVLAAHMVAEAFLAMSRTADAATLAPLVGRLSALRSDRPAPQTEYLVADGGSLQRVPSTPRPSEQPLTVAELRVAVAVADGLSNRAVAEQLLVSAKTIEFHLGNIFRKLGLRNRAELASLRGQLGQGSRLA